ncbi:MAG: SDR family oxidoreductase [Flavobacterium sp.]|nr:SDR family oxidoreductase [Flavobacterium sp.]
MKNVIVTGTGKGIGFETALQLANQNINVLALSRNIRLELAQHPNITCLSVDLADAEAFSTIRYFLENDWKHVDAIIHNAGSLVLKPFAETTLEDFINVYTVNVFAVTQLNNVVLPFMKSGGHVVTISSIGGVQGSVKFAGLSAYSSSKGAVITLSELLAEEYRERGISFNVLALGSVQTEMLATAFPGYEAPISAADMASYIANFTLTGNKFYNGKVLQVSSTTP